MAITVGSVEVGIVPNTRGIYNRLRAGLVPAATRAGADAGRAAGRAFGPAMSGAVSNAIATRIGQQLGQQIAARITAQIRTSLQQGITQGGAMARPAAARQGLETGGAFARTLRARLVEAFRSMPRLDISLNDTGVDAELARLRARMETLSNKRIGVDVDVTAADAEVADISERLRRLGAAHPNVAVRADTAAARAALEEIRAEIARVSARPGVIRLETDGSFGARMRAAVQAAEQSLPNINIGADTSPAQAQLASLRAQLTALRDQRVGIDIDAATASARIDEIRTRLAALSASSADIAVRVDAATAEAQLAQVAAIADALDGNDIDLHVSNAQALSAILQVSVAIAALAAIPAIPILAAGTGSLVSAFTVAGVGVGAFAAAALPALSSVKGALDAQKQAQDAATTATAKSGQVAGQAASRALQMAGAQQALASAERNGARRIAQAQQAVVQAKRAVGDAVQQAALKQQQADRAVADAEKSLTQSQTAAKQAQSDLTQARKTAAQQLQDLASSYANAQLSQRDAELQLTEAKKALDAVNRDPKATRLQRQEAQLAYDQAKQQLADQTTATGRLKDQQAAAAKAGVNGSDVVVQAQDNVVQAQQAVVDQTQALKDAQAEQARTEVANARSISDAQAKVADAVRNVADAQASAADSIASAQRQVQSASLSAAGGVDASVTAASKYQAALAKLSPSARGTFDAFVGLRSAFKGWSLELQPAIMPIFTRALNGLKDSLPGLTPIVLGAARGIGILQDKVSKGFKSPWWKELKADFATSVEPAIVGVGTAIGKVFVGAAGIVDAFLPHIESISGRMDRITGRFANFGKNLKGSPAFENFLSYSAEQAPKLADALGKIGTALVDTAKAVSPLSGPVLVLLGGLATAISAVATSTPGLIQLLYGLFIVTRLVTLAQIAMNGAMLIYRAGVVLATLLTGGWTAAILAANLAFEANPIVAVVTIIIAALALLVVGILYAWNHWGWFRDVVLGVWHAIQAASLYAWNNVLKPTFNAIAQGALWLWTNAIRPAFNGIVSAYQAVARWAVWLWQNILAPVFRVLGVIVGVWWRINKIYFTALWLIIRMVAAIALWFWHSVMDPVFKALRVIVSIWWAAIKFYFNANIALFRLFASVALWLWTHGIRPAFQAIGDMGKWLWAKALKPAFDAMKTGIEAIGKSFVTAKDLISDQWSKVADLAKKPISFLINTVYNKGILAVWNKVADIVDGPHLKPVKIKGFAAGGVAEGVRPGYTPGRDTHVVAVGGGEAIMRPEVTRAVGAPWVDAVNAAARSGGVGGVKRALGMPGFFGGGIVDTIKSGAKSVGGAIKSGVTTGIDWAKTGVDLLANPGRIFDKLMGPVRDLIKKMGTSQWAKLTQGLPLQALTGLKDKVLDLVGLGSGGGDGGGKIPSGQHAAIITQAMAAARVPPPGTMGQWLTGMNTLIGRESGWNASAINNWDSNAKAGHPSQGLTQTIPGTWARYVPSPLKSRGILDPVGNVAASIRYIVSRYGNITGVQQANASMPPQGYDSGGYLRPGLNLAYNGTGRPEPVFTTQQANALTSMGQPGDPSIGDVHVKVWVGDREITDIARTEVTLGMTDLAATLRAGRKG